MAAKNSVKQFVENGYYHIYNRGVEKRTIFLEPQDYSVFLSYLKTYLLPKDTNKLWLSLAEANLPWAEKAKILKLIRLNNFSSSLNLLSFCLRPNHFHLLVRQTDANTIDKFMNSLGTRYGGYFNRKYKRVGPLFQGLYKAVLVNTDEQLLHLTRYIHRNPIPLIPQDTLLQNYEYSSYPYFLGTAHSDWVKPDTTLSHFARSGPNSYQSFVEDRALEADSITRIASLTLDFED